MRKRIKLRTNRKGKKVRTISIKNIVTDQKHLEADTALQLVEVYEAVERTYRAAIMAGEAHAGVAYSTNY
jgi:hypothetical protein